MEGWGPALILISLVSPVAIIVGVIVGSLSRRWWHATLASALVPAAHWLIYQPDRITLLPFLAVAGLLWGSVTFAFKKQLIA